MQIPFIGRFAKIQIEIKLMWGGKDRGEVAKGGSV